MPNTLLTIDMITNECLRLAHEKASFIGTINRQFDDSFGASDGKIGDTLRIRLPSQYTRRQGSRVMDVQNAEEQRTQLVVATQDGVDMRFNSRELKLDLQNFSKVHLEPAMATVVSGIESDVLQGLTQGVWNVAGTAGSPPTTLVAPGAARARLNQMLAPKDNNRCIQMDSVTMGGLVNGVAAYFNPTSDISKQFREGLVSRTSMADYYENERVWTLANAASVSGMTLNNVTLANGTASVAITGGTLPTTGQYFTLAGVFACHPETKAAYSNLQQFVCLAGSTATTFNIAPTIYISGARKNVSTSTGANITPADVASAALVFGGSASTSYVQNLMYHKDFATFATAELPMMADAISCVIKTYDGISLRVWRASDIRNDEVLTRLDILYGYALIRGQWACRITS